MRIRLSRALPRLRGLSGAAAGLFLARVALEATHRPWPVILIVAVALLAAMLGFFLATRKSAIGNWSSVILLAYVFWPQRALLVAAAVAWLAALVWMSSVSRPVVSPRAELGADVVLFAAALACYWATLARDVLPADAGEFQLAAALLGVAHPPGYPLYTLVGHLFTRLVPLGNPAYRLNLMSAILAAGTLVFVARATRLWARRLGAAPLTALGGGLAAALALGTATTFWAQATIANVRTPAVFFAALALYTLARFAIAEARDKDRALWLFALALGLGGGHYPPLAFIAVFFVLYLLLTDPRLIVQPRRWWKPALVGLAALLLPLIYLPVRGARGAILAPSNLNTLRGFFWHVTAGGFSGDMFAFATAAMLPHRLALLPTLFRFQFHPILLALALLGLASLVWREWRLFVLLVGSLALHTFVTVTYRAPQTVEYLMPAYLPVAIAVGLLPACASFYLRVYVSPCPPIPEPPYPPASSPPLPSGPARSTAMPTLPVTSNWRAMSAPAKPSSRFWRWRLPGRASSPTGTGPCPCATCKRSKGSDPMSRCATSGRWQVKRITRHGGDLRKRP